ncbi:polysaccharide biosynthesis protein [Pseudanabaena sp. ABRG5-3]|uniref:polysaccharide biosynthesis protein n=1 Tax=Pseudanabaena sp. ABRG5-3 TaxID=685565 RepID=UPI000DC6FA0F|nr:polysaccharide biosynthesis protein [Pseudanabaena sp. ABRG5-3]BBC27195.1 polysaccharide_biosynthesis_protein [Pseudanabaena sp. ABRG5-3]
MKKNILDASKVRNRYYFIVDTLIFLIITTLALIVRLDGNLGSIPNYQWLLCFATLFFASIKLSTLIGFGIYSRFWQYAGARDFIDIASAIFLATVIEAVALNFLYNLSGSYFPVISNLPRSLFLIDALLSLVAVSGFRYGMRELLQHRKLRNARCKVAMPQSNTRVLIVGAGNAGTSLVRQMQVSSEHGLLPIAFIDDNPSKLHQKILGINVVGNRFKIGHVIQSMRIDKVIIAMPSAAGENIRAIVEICNQRNVPVITLPSLTEILSGDRGIKVNNLRNVEIEDLLRRQPIETDLQKVSELVRGKKILVTGAGGSIGSEICRQVCNFQPSEIMLLGKGENSIFLIHQELEKAIQSMGLDIPVPKLHTYICDIRSYSRLKYIFENFRPNIVFHAAAHKHVPLMELNPPEAITTNIFGTKNLVELANAYNVENFVMISTDKSVNPTNIMGATKRVAEMVVLQIAKKYHKSFTVVRFGNVLGSRGSVVPTFKRQIAAGGPVTITHPDIIRYFMTIPEAVQLVLQTSVLGRGGEVCMLDMGEPVKIVDLAKDLIHLSGYEVGKDIDIVYTGLRPGEKLFEELFIPGEKYERTEHEKIRVVWNASDRLPQHLDATLAKLAEAAEYNDSWTICTLLKTIVLGYVPSLSFNSESDETVSELVADKLGDRELTAINQNLKIDMNKLAQVSRLEHIYNQSSNDGIDYYPVYQPRFSARDLQTALEEQQFIFYYQPIVDLKTKKTIGFESFLRWQHPEQGLIASCDFIEDLEESGLIIALGWWTIDEICHHINIWEQQFPNKPIEISLNLSVQQFFHPDLLAQITTIIYKYAISPASLALEIPESTIRNNPQMATTILSKLKALGVKLQLDKFGIDLDFVNYSQAMPLLYSQFDRLKIHQTVIQDLTNNNHLLISINKFAQALNIDVIAVGVETSAQRDRLESLNCKYGQGYLFAKPSY